MKGAILVMSDSFRADHLGCYGSEKRFTPNLDRLAEDATVFERSYIASYATIPNRQDLVTGRYNFPYRGWEPLAPGDVTLPQVLRKHGVHSQIIFDTPPVLAEKIYSSFSGWRYIRGHHVDPWVTDPRIPTTLPAAPYKFKNVERTKQYLRNRHSWVLEGDYIAPRTFKEATEWLERNCSRPFFLMIDTWDPHEPFDPPAHYLRKYAEPSEDVENIIYPAYGHSDYMTDEEMKQVRALYAGEVTMVDTSMGRLMETLQRLNILDTTLVIFTSDHGHLFGEHGLQGKPGGVLGRLYEETTRIPLIIRHPENRNNGNRIRGLTQPPDIMPTILDYFGYEIPRTVHGKSLTTLITGKEKEIRMYAFSGRYTQQVGQESPWQAGVVEAQIFDGWSGPPRLIAPVTVTGNQWALICSPKPELSELYDLQKDPKQQLNLVREENETAQEMREALITFMTRLGGKDEFIKPFENKSKEKETLDMNTTLYTFQNKRGKTLAFTSKEEAEKRTGEKLRTTTFSETLKENPKTLIYIGDQYYWAEELK